jgi:uncharacterized Fe-S cluster-containing MiaB family protein
LKADLQVAIGLETAHPEVLPRLNKQMTLEDFSSSVQFLERKWHFIQGFYLYCDHHFLSEEEGLDVGQKIHRFCF